MGWERGRREREKRGQNLPEHPWGRGSRKQRSWRRVDVGHKGPYRVIKARLGAFRGRVTVERWRVNRCILPTPQT